MTICQVSIVLCLFGFYVLLLNPADRLAHSFTLRDPHAFPQAYTSHKMTIRRTVHDMTFGSGASFTKLQRRPVSVGHDCELTVHTISADNDHGQ